MSITITNPTPRAKRVIAQATKLAAEYQHAYVGTEHLFLALLRSGSASIFESLQVAGLSELDRSILIARVENNLAKAQKRTDPDPDLVKEGAKALRKMADFIEGLR